MAEPGAQHAHHAGYQRRVKAMAQPTVPLQEVGLKALQPITKQLAKISPQKSAPLLQSISQLLKHVAPLRMFSDFSPAHSPPEAPILLSEAQVNSDTTRPGSSYSCFSAFDPKHAEAFVNPSASPSAASSASASVWCSKSRPSNNKSCITVVLAKAEQLTGIFLELPSENGMKPELIGIEVLHAPAVNPAPSSAQPSLPSDSAPLVVPSSGNEMSASDIAAYLHRPNLKWHPLGVLSQQMFEDRSPGGIRVPVSANNVIAVRLSFKGYAKANNERYHGLAKCVLFKASDRIKPGVGGHALYTESTAVLHTLDSWFKAVGTAAAATITAPHQQHQQQQQEAQDASILSLAGLSLATGSLSSTLSLIEVLLSYQRATLPPALSRAVKSYLFSLDALFDAVAMRTSPGGGKGAAKVNPDRTAEAKWSDKSSSVTLSEGDTRARSSSSPEYCALNIGIAKGKMVWEMKIEEDSMDGECQCFGICKKPVTSYSYDSSSCNMWLWRAYK